MPVGAILGAAGVGSALISGSAAKSAASAQSQAATQAAQYQLQAAREAAALQLGMFNTIRGDFAPYRAAGEAALPGYMALLGLPSPSYSRSDGALNLPFMGGGSLTTGSAGGSMFGTPRVGDVNWSQLLKDRPDVLNQYNKLMTTADPNSPWYAQHGLDKGPEGFAQWWYYNGKPENDAYEAPAWTQEQIDSMYGGGGGGAPAGPAQPALGYSGIQDYLENLPGYKFVRDQGIRGVTNSLASKGLGGISGPMAKGIARFVTGLADTTYGEQLARIGSVVGTGQNAAAQTGGFGTQAASGAAGSLVGGGNAIAQGITGAANAQAAGTIGAANAASSGLSNAANAYLTSRILGMYGG